MIETVSLATENLVDIVAFQFNLCFVVQSAQDVKVLSDSLYNNPF